MSLPASLLLGALLGTAYSAAALLVARHARSLEPNRALRVILAGMLVRMVLTLTAFALILAAVPVQRGPFVLGLGVVFVLGLGAEALLVLGRPAPTPDPSDS